jgi:hypothetical protein
MSETLSNKRIHTIINFLFVLTIVLATLFSFYKYFYTKNYNFRVQSECDSSIENCFYNEEENTYYKIFLIKAYSFIKCSDNSCKIECEQGLIECVAVTCNEDEGDSCSMALE